VAHRLNELAGRVGHELGTLPRNRSEEGDEP
jgi:hypothetical protein